MTRKRGIFDRVTDIVLILWAGWLGYLSLTSLTDGEVTGVDMITAAITAALMALVIRFYVATHKEGIQRRIWQWRYLKALRVYGITKDDIPKYAGLGGTHPPRYEADCEFCWRSHGCMLRNDHPGGYHICDIDLDSWIEDGYMEVIERGHPDVFHYLTGEPESLTEQA